MNRKNTILIAVLINAGLLTVLLVAALTTQEITAPQAPEIAQNELTLPKFDDSLLYQELPEVKPLEIETKEEPKEAPVVHALPKLVEKQESEKVVAAPVVKVPKIIEKPTSTGMTNEIVVKKGDNLERLARKHHTSVDEIIKLNRLPSSFLKIGQVLKIPASRSLAKAEKRAPDHQGPEYYTIKVGENPWAIALRYHMKLDELLRLNGLNEEKARKLRPGDRLRIR